MLINSTIELKQFTKVNKNMAWDSLQESVELAEQKYLLPVLDTPQYSDLQADLTANTLDADQTKLLKYCRRVIANGAMYLAYPSLNIHESDMGIQQTKSREGTSEPAVQWRYQEARNFYLVTAAQAIEDLYIFLQENKTTYLLWANGKGFSVYNELFIRNNKELGQYINTADSVRTYVAMQPYIRLAERKYIISVVTPTKVSELKTALLTNSLTTDQKAELEQIRFCLAWCAYYESIPFISYEIGTQAITVAMQLDGMTKKNAVSLEERKMLAKAAYDTMTPLLEDLKKTYIVSDEQTTETLPCNAFKNDFWV
jgi:hypothetical protein